MIRRLVLAAGAVLLAGCTTVQDLYPRFKEQSAGMQAVAITTDVLVLEDVKGPLPLVDVPRDLSLARNLTAFLQEELAKRGLKVVAAEVSSVGLHYASAVTPPIKVRAEGQAASLSVAELGTARGPFYLAPAYAEPAQSGLLQNVFVDLRRYTPKPGAPNLTSRTLTKLPVVPDATHRLFVLAEGVQVPMGKGLGQALVTGLISLGTVSVFEMTTVNFRLGIADARTGEFILVEDCSLAGGWTVDDAYLRRQAGIFLAHFDRLRKP